MKRRKLVAQAWQLVGFQVWEENEALVSAYAQDTGAVLIPDVRRDHALAIYRIVQEARSYEEALVAAAEETAFRSAQDGLDSTQGKLAAMQTILGAGFMYDQFVERIPSDDDTLRLLVLAIRQRDFKDHSGSG